MYCVDDAVLVSFSSTLCSTRSPWPPSLSSDRPYPKLFRGSRCLLSPELEVLVTLHILGKPSVFHSPGTEMPPRHPDIWVAVSSNPHSLEACRRSEGQQVRLGLLVLPNTLSDPWVNSSRFFASSRPLILSLISALCSGGARVQRNRETLKTLAS